MPSLQELLADQAQLLMSDALAVRDGLYPPMEDEARSPLSHLARVRQMFADLPEAYARRADKDATTAKAEPAAAGVPDYYAQDFHFQTGGYLTEGPRGSTTCRSRRCSWARRAPCGARRLRPSPSSCAGATSARSRCSMWPAARGASCARCGSPTRP